MGSASFPFQHCSRASTLLPLAKGGVPRLRPQWPPWPQWPVVRRYKRAPRRAGAVARGSLWLAVPGALARPPFVRDMHVQCNSRPVFACVSIRKPPIRHGSPSVSLQDGRLCLSADCSTTMRVGSNLPEPGSGNWAPAQVPDRERASRTVTPTQQVRVLTNVCAYAPLEADWPPPPHQCLTRALPGSHTGLAARRAA